MIKELNHRLEKIESLLLEKTNNEVIFLNISEASEFLKYKKSTLYQLVFHRKIPFYKKGKKLLFKKSELVSWIEKEKNDTVEELATRLNLSKIIERNRSESVKWKIMK